jgi:hypothetical protein
MGDCTDKGGLGSVEPLSSSLRSPPPLLSGIWWEYEKRLRSMPERLSPLSVKEDSISLTNPSRSKAHVMRGPFAGVPYLFKGSRFTSLVLAATRFLFSSRKVLEDCALINPAYKYGRIPRNSNIAQATIDMQRVHVVFERSNHDSYPSPSNQDP